MFILFYSFPPNKNSSPLYLWGSFPQNTKLVAFLIFFLPKWDSYLEIHSETNISPKRPKFPRNVRNFRETSGMGRLPSSRRGTFWDDHPWRMTYVARSSRFPASSNSRERCKDVGSGSRVDSLTRLNFTPKKNVDSTKMVQQLKTVGFKKLEEERSRFFAWNHFCTERFN